MPSFRISISPRKSASGRFIDRVRRQLQKAFAEENASQTKIARELDVHRSVVNRQLHGFADMSLGRVAEYAALLNREIVFDLQRPQAELTQNIEPSTYRVVEHDFSRPSGVTISSASGTMARQTFKVEQAAR